eukprot:scaffold2821_cov186-Skeletonema_dohrnii-CCMP3373.AAC.1
MAIHRFLCIEGFMAKFTFVSRKFVLCRRFVFEVHINVYRWNYYYVTEYSRRLTPRDLLTPPHYLLTPPRCLLTPPQHLLTPPQNLLTSSLSRPLAKSVIYAKVSHIHMCQ